MKKLGIDPLRTGLLLLAAAPWCVVASDAPQSEVHPSQGRYGGLPAPTYPGGAPPSQAEIRLGEKLFFDRLLSAHKDVACSTCHRPDHGFADTTPVSRGTNGQAGVRNSPTVSNVAFLTQLSWDGIATDIEDQSIRAITNVAEGGLTLENASAYVRKRYGVQLLSLYGAADIHAAAKALGAYQRSLIYGHTPFDRYLYSRERTAISESAKRGWKLFIGDARCVECHSVRCEDCHPFGGRGALLTDNRFHNIGIGFETGAQPRDPGRYSVTHAQVDMGSFRTPTLRNVELTGPYMHDGSLKSLEEVIDYYNKGGNKNSNLDPELHELELTDQDKKDLVAFLKSLTSPELRSRFRGFPLTGNSGDSRE